MAIEQGRDRGIPSIRAGNGIGLSNSTRSEDLVQVASGRIRRLKMSLRTSEGLAMGRR